MNNVSANASRFGALALGAVALCCAGLAAYIISGMMSSRYAKTKVTPIVVAKAELKVGEPISADELMLVDWPQEAVPSGAFLSVDKLLSSFDTVTPTVGILAGEPVVTSRLSDAAHGTGVAALIEPNMRAVALEVDASTANTGLVYPGAYVDVIVTFRDANGEGPGAYTAVQRAQVLSVGFDVDVATQKKRSGDTKKNQFNRARDTAYVTLQVTPEEAEIIGVARSEGKIDLTLRNGTDSAIVETSGARPTNVMPEPELAEDEEEEKSKGKRSRSKRKSAKSDSGRRQRRSSRYRSSKIRLVAKDRPSSDRRKSRSSGIETYRAQ